MEITDKEITLLTKTSRIALEYDLIDSDYTSIKIAEFLNAAINQETKVSGQGFQAAYDCLFLVLDLIDGQSPNVKIKFTDKRKLIPLKQDIINLTERINNHYHFDN